MFFSFLEIIVSLQSDCDHESFMAPILWSTSFAAWHRSVPTWPFRWTRTAPLFNAETQRTL